MSGKSQFLEQAVLNILGGAVAPAPVTVYLGLFSVSPVAGGSGGTEATGTGYARLAITCNTTNFPAAAGGGPATISNGPVLTMATAGADWSAGANMVAFGLFDALTSGHLLYWGPLATPAPVLSGNTPVFAAGALVITEA